MPIEIKELHIRVTINTPPSGRSSESGITAPGTGDATNDSIRDTIVAECVEQVLQVIQNKKER